MTTGLLAFSDLCLGTGAAVGLALIAAVSIKLWRENRRMHRLMDEQEPAAFLDAFYQAHPEARPLSKRFILSTFVALLLALIVLLVLSRR